MIIVFGSINMDMVIPVPHFPVAGETVLGLGDYAMLPGGKGANQALAAARMGPKVALVGQIGDDGTGMRLMAGLRRDGVVTSGVGQSDKPTGMAIIMTDPTGENQIVVATGANMDVRQDQVPDEILGPDAFLMLQGETPLEENWALLQRAKNLGTHTFMNLAPVIDIPVSALEQLDYLVINELEVKQIADALKMKADNALNLATALATTYKLTCIVTLGEKGSFAVTPTRKLIHVEALAIEDTVDRTGAGDAYCGTLAAMLYVRKPLEDAMKMASIAGSLACTKKGTQSAYAYLGEIEENLGNLAPPVIKTI